MPSVEKSFQLNESLACLQALSLFIGTFFLISFALAVKELQGPKRSAPLSASPISARDHPVGIQRDVIETRKYTESHRLP